MWKYHRYRNRLAEVDLIFYHKKFGWELVEVKTSRRGRDLDFLCIRQKQARRLSHFLIWWQSKYSEPAQFSLAVVGDQSRVHIYPDFLCHVL